MSLLNSKPTPGGSDKERINIFTTDKWQNPEINDKYSALSLQVDNFSKDYSSNMNIVSVCFNPRTQDVEIWILPGNQELPQICKIIKKNEANEVFARFEWKVESIIDHMYVSKAIGKSEYELRLTDPD